MRAIGALHAIIDRTARKGRVRKTRGRLLQKATSNIASPSTDKASHTYYMTLWTSTIVFQPSCARWSDCRPSPVCRRTRQTSETEDVSRLQTVVRRGPPCPRKPREDGNEEEKKNQEMSPRVCSYSRFQHNFNHKHRHPGNPKSQDGRETKAPNPPAENSSTPRLSRARLSKTPGLTPLPSLGLVIQQEEWTKARSWTLDVLPFCLLIRLPD